MAESGRVSRRVRKVSTRLSANGHRAGVARRGAAVARARAGERRVADPTYTASHAAALPGRGSSTRRLARARSPGRSSRVELQHRIRVAAEDLTHAARPSAVGLPPDNEWLVWPHIEDRQHGAAAQRVGDTDLGNAIHASPPCPQPQDATGARSTAHLEFDHAAHVVVRALDESRVGIDTRDEKRGHVGLEPAAAGILRESCAHRPGLDLALELGDQLGMPLRFPVYRILQPLDEAL